MKIGTRTGILTMLLSACLSLQAQTLKEAVKLTEREQYDLAAAAFLKLIAAQPAGGTEYFYYGENFLLGDNKDSARIIFSKGLEADPANVLNFIGLAKIELDNGNPDKGMKLIDDALAKAGPKNSLALIEAADALVHFKAKNLDRAAQLLDKAIALDPRNPDIYLIYGDIHSERNNGSSAAEQYNKALELDRTSVRAIVSKGKLYKRSTNFEGAADEFKNAIQIDPNYAPAHRELGDAYIKMGKLEPAKEEYRKYLDLSRNNCEARRRYATFLYIGKDYAGALAEIANLRQNCDSNNVTMLRVASYCYFELKDYAKAAERVQRLFSVLPEEKRTLTDYEYFGKIMIATNSDTLGTDALWKAYRMDRTRTDLLIELGNAFIKMKKYDDAAAAFREKIQYGRDVKSADYFKLGQSYFFAQHFPEADTALNKLVELQPKWPTGFLWAAKNKTRIDSTSQAGLAKPMYEKYIELAIADTANAAKYTEGLKEAYGYLASYYFLQMKDNRNTLMYLRKKLDLVTDPSEKKEIQTMIDQIEGKK